MTYTYLNFLHKNTNIITEEDIKNTISKYYNT